MAGQSESGLCQCNEFIMNPSPTSDTSAQPRDLSLDDNGLKCLASNGKPCHFPFKHKGKVIIKVPDDHGLSSINFQVLTSCTMDSYYIPWCSTKGINM